MGSEKGKKIDIMGEDWDYLIILDACRYDYFSQFYSHFFEGELEKLISPSSCTREWCLETFTGYYPDVIYVSANPYINSRVEIANFCAKHHFHRVIDVWDYGWDNKLGTVHPMRVNETVLTLRDKYPSKRFIIHYLQPHAPYLSPRFSLAGFPKPQPGRKSVLSGVSLGTRGNRILEGIVDNIGRICKNKGTLWKIREILKLPPASPMDAIRRIYGIYGLREAYIENLIIVLEHVAFLVKNLSGTIVITSDHGELLGEKGKFSHPCGETEPILREVPWFKVKSVKREFEPPVIRRLEIRRRVRGVKHKILRKYGFTLT